jgi:hypothetical protein
MPKVLQEEVAIAQGSLESKLYTMQALHSDHSD